MTKTYIEDDPFLYEEPSGNTDDEPRSPTIGREPAGPRNLWDLPIWGEFWKADARGVER